MPWFRRSRSAVLSTALAALLAACPAASVATAGLQFTCAADDDCLPGQTCQGGLCVEATASTDAGALRLDAAADRDAAGSDVPAADLPRQEGGALDGSTAEAASDAPGPELPAPDTSAADSVAVDSSVDAQPDLDAAPLDTAADDTATAPDVRDDVGAEDAVADAASADTQLADTGAVDASAADLMSEDLRSEDTRLPDVSSVDTALPDSGLPADWWDPAWRVRRTLVVDSSGLTEVLSDVPVLVRLRAGNTDYSRIQDQGQDLRFFLLDGTGPLAHEIERWDESGDSFVWVKVPQLDVNSSGDLLRLYYGNPAAADGQRVTEVWSGGFVGVWHMHGNPTAGAGAVRDSSSSGKHGTCLNMSAGDLVAGQVGQALDLDGSNDVIDIDGSAAAGNPLDIVGGPMTLSAWIYADGTTGTILARRNDGAVQWQLQIGERVAGGEHSIDFLWADASNLQNLWSTSATFPTSTWRYVTVVIAANGTPLAFYTGDTPRAFGQTAATSGGPLHRNVDVSIGARWAGGTGTGFLFDGVLDEVRVEKVARSQSWVTIQRRSMTYNLFTMGALETLP